MRQKDRKYLARFSRGSNKTLAIAGVFISLMVGAGFITGRELLVFFVRYGARGALGFIISCAILGFVGFAVMDLARRLRVKGYRELMSVILGGALGNVCVFAVNIFIFVMMATMLAGFGAAMNESLGIGFTVGVLAMGGFCFFTYLFDLKGIVRACSVLAPILVVGGLFFGVFHIMTDAAPVFSQTSFGGLAFLWPAVIYASYNLLTAASVLSSMGEEVKSRKIALNSALISAVIIFLLGMTFFISMHMNFPAVLESEIPLLALSQSSGALLRTTYIILLAAAIFTTAASCGFAVIEWLASFNLGGKKIPRLAVKTAVSLGGVILAHLGFSAFVDRIYPIFGYIGLFQIAALVLFFLFGRKSG